MPKVRKFKGYDYTKQFHELKEENLSKDSSSLYKFNPIRNNSAFQKSYQSSDIFEDDSYQIQPPQQTTAHNLSVDSEADSNNEQNSFIQNPSKSDSMDSLKDNKDEVYFEQMDEEKLSNQSFKQQKKEKKHDSSTATYDKRQKLEEASQKDLEDAPIRSQDFDYCEPGSHDDYILQFNQQKQKNLLDVVRTNYNCNNNYLRLELTLDAKKKMMTDKIKELLHNKYPQILSEKEEPTLSAPSTGKLESPSKQTNKKQDKPIKRKKKRRTIVTAKILSQIQIFFRQYEEQQTFKNTPFYKKRITIKTMADAINVSQTEVKHLYDEFLTDPLFNMRLARMSTNEERQMSAIAQQMLDIRLKFLEQLISKNCVITQQQIADEMNQCQDLLTRDKNNHLIPINKRCVQYLLKKGNYSRKKVQLVPKNRNSPQSVQNRYHYCKRYLELLEIPDVEIYFLDQSRFNMLTVRDRGWAKKGIPATKVTVNSKGKDIILLAMISINGIAFYQLSDGFNAAAFTISMDKIGKMLKEKGANPHRYIIMDNCPIHNRQNLKHIEQAHQLKIVYLPPYTPMVNPIQYWFNEIKNVIRTKTYKTRKEMKDSLQAALANFRVKNMSNYYDCIKPYLELGMKRELFK